MNEGYFDAGYPYTMEKYAIQVGVDILPVASCRSKRRPDGRLGSNTNFIFYQQPDTESLL